MLKREVGQEGGVDPRNTLFSLYTVKLMGFLVNEMNNGLIVK